MKKRKLFGLLCALLTAVYFTGCPDPDPTVEEKKIVCTFLDESGNTLLTQEFDVTYTSGSANIEYIKYNDKFKKTGYKFEKFADANGNEVKEISADSTVYVVYSPITYTVKFSKGLGEETEDGKLPAEITVKYDEEFTLPDNKLSYSGKKAVGWYTEEYDLDTLKSEKKRYSNGDKLKNLTERDNDTIEFTADFNDFDCVVTFVIGNDRKTFNLDKDSALPEIPEIPEKTGYTIGGWVEYDDDDTTNTIVDFTDYKVTKTVTYTAKYNPKSYKVTFKTAYGTAPDAITRYADASSELLSVSPYNSLTATGYNFAGWFDENDKEYKYLTSYASDWENGDLPDLTLTAKWTPWTIHQVFVDASTELESLPDGYYYDTRASYLTRDVDYDTEVTMPGAELYKSLPDGFKLVGWVKGDEYGKEIKKSEADYEVSAAFKNGDVTKDGETIYFYGFVEGPSVKIAVKVPYSVEIDEEAQIKPSSSNAAFAFDSVYLSESGKEFPFSNTVNKKDDYYVLNKTASSYATLYPEMFAAGSHSYKLKGYLGYSYEYEQTISVTIVEGVDVSLNFNDMKYTKTSYGDPQGHILLNFKPEEGITVTGVKFAEQKFQVTDNLWNYSTISDLGTKSLVIYMDKDGKTYMSDEIKIQTAKGCISSSTIAFEFTNNNIVMTINQQ